MCTHKHTYPLQVLSLESPDSCRDSDSVDRVMVPALKLIASWASPPHLNVACDEMRTVHHPRRVIMRVARDETVRCQAPRTLGCPVPGKALSTHGHIHRPLCPGGLPVSVLLASQRGN